MTSRPAALVTGASGAIGGVLVERLLREGRLVRCLVREPARLHRRWRSEVEVVPGDASDPRAVARAAQGCAVAYYLVHGLDGPLSSLVERERATARAFRTGAADAEMARIVYLGGLVDEERLTTVSQHLYARQQAGVELCHGPVPVTELRAGIVVSPDSASLRLLVAAARFPLQVWGRWARSRVQPIALDDLLAVLVAAGDDPGSASTTVELGGPDVVTYAALVGAVRRALGLRRAPRLFVPGLPVEATVAAASELTGLPPRLVLALLQSLAEDAVVRDASTSRRYGELVRTPLEVALRTALAAGR